MYRIYIYTNHPLVPALRIPGPNRPRLLLVAVLRGKKKLVVHFGLPCASWVLLSRGTTARSWLAPLGDVSVKCVADANLLCSRLGILKAINLEYLFNNLFQTINSKQCLPLYWQDVPLDHSDPSSPGKLHYRAAVHITNFSASTISPTHLYV